MLPLVTLKNILTPSPPKSSCGVADTTCILTSLFEPGHGPLHGQSLGLKLWDSEHTPSGQLAWDEVLVAQAGKGLSPGGVGGGLGVVHSQDTHIVCGITAILTEQGEMCVKVFTTCILIVLNRVHFEYQSITNYITA